MNNIAIIGDVHGKIKKYTDIIKNFEYSVQIGDMGFKQHYDALKKMEYDKSKHVFFPGNHDDYNSLPDFSLTNFGMRNIGGFKFFFVRGADSIDKNMRIPFVSWWPNEQLSDKQFRNCMNEYEKAKPDFFLSHDCPMFVYSAILKGEIKNNATALFLKELFHIHKPKLWIFGHHHKSLSIKIHDTEFRCLNELETFVV